jgi:hypothetical protein
MKWPFFSKRSSVQHAWIERYQRLRQVGRDLNLTLVKQLPKAAVAECGKKLGLFKAGTLILNNEDEIAILYDYGLHHYRRDHKNVIERYLEHSPPAPDSLELTLLQAMLHARFSVFRVQEIKPRQGALLLDLVQGEPVELVDRALSETGTAGTILVGRLLPLGDFYMSSGTLIPLPEEVYEDKLVPIVRKFTPDSSPDSRATRSAAQEAAYVAQLIRVSLHEGGMDNVFYTDMESVD